MRSVKLTKAGYPKAYRHNGRTLSVASKGHNIFLCSSHAVFPTELARGEARKLSKWFAALANYEEGKWVCDV